MYYKLMVKARVKFSCGLKTNPIAINIGRHCYEFKKELQSDKKSLVFHASTLTNMSQVQPVDFNMNRTKSFIKNNRTIPHKSYLLLADM